MYLLIFRVKHCVLLYIDCSYRAVTNKVRRNEWNE